MAQSTVKEGVVGDTKLLFIKQFHNNDWSKTVRV